MPERIEGNPVVGSTVSLYCIEDIRKGNKQSATEKGQKPNAQVLYLTTNDGYVCTIIADGKRSQVILTVSLEDLDAVVQSLKERRNKETWKTKSSQASQPIDESSRETSLADW